MNAIPVRQKTFAAKIWDLAYGSLLIGGAPLVAFGILSKIFMLSGDLFVKVFGEEIGGLLGIMGLGIAFLSPFLAYGFAIWWRADHRALPIKMLLIEILLGSFLAFYYYFFSFGLGLP